MGASYQQKVALSQALSTHCFGCCGSTCPPPRNGVLEWGGWGWWGAVCGSMVHRWEGLMPVGVPVPGSAATSSKRCSLPDSQCSQLEALALGGRGQPSSACLPSLPYDAAHGGCTRRLGCCDWRVGCSYTSCCRLCHTGARVAAAMPTPGRRASLPIPAPFASCIPSELTCVVYGFELGASVCRGLVWAPALAETQRVSPLLSALIADAHVHVNAHVRRAHVRLVRVSCGVSDDAFACDVEGGGGGGFRGR